MNTALRARLKHARKNTRRGKAVARKTKKLRKKTFYPQPRNV